MPKMPNFVYVDLLVKLIRLVTFLKVNLSHLVITFALGLQPKDGGFRCRWDE